MKRFILLFVIASLAVPSIVAGGGKLVLVMEKGASPAQDYVWGLHPESYVSAAQTVWKDGKLVTQMKNTPNGWFISYCDDGGDDSQRVTFDKKGNVVKKIKEWNGMGLCATSLAYEGLDGLGRAYFVAFGKKTGWEPKQVVDVLSTKKVPEFVAKHSKDGYRITQMAGTEKAWGVVLSKATDIVEQELCFYKDYDEMIDDVAAHWNEGWPIQLIEIDATGKYAVVYAEYSDGRCPEQYLSVCSTSEEAANFVRTHKAEGYEIVSAGGSYLEGLLCNYDSPAEKMNAILGITNGLLETLQNSPLVNSGGGTSVSEGANDGGAGSVSASVSRASGSPENTADCNLCLGSGRCKYCNGDGYNYTAGTPVQCKGCVGHIGRCKRCKGTGKITRSGKVKY